MIYLVGGFPGTWLDYFSIILGNVIIPIDFHIFQRGGPTTNQPSSLAFLKHGALVLVRESEVCLPRWTHGSHRHLPGGGVPAPWHRGTHGLIVSISGWYFGPVLFFNILGGIIIPTDYHSFQRGRSTTFNHQLWKITIFEWENPLYIVIFNSYVSHYQWSYLFLWFIDVAVTNSRAPDAPWPSSTPGGAVTPPWSSAWQLPSWPWREWMSCACPNMLLGPAGDGWKKKSDRV